MTTNTSGRIRFRRHIHRTDQEGSGDQHDRRQKCAERGKYANGRTHGFGGVFKVSFADITSDCYGYPHGQTGYYHLDHVHNIAACCHSGNFRSTAITADYNQVYSAVKCLKKHGKQNRQGETNKREENRSGGERIALRRLCHGEPFFPSVIVHEKTKCFLPERDYVFSIADPFFNLE